MVVRIFPIALILSILPTKRSSIKYKFLLNLFLVLSYICPLSAQTYGLHFASRETIPEKRTSLDLTPGKPLCFKEAFSIDFDLHFTPGQARYSGYIFRVINKSSENIDLLFDNRDTLFKIVYKGSFTNLRFKSAGRFFSWNKIRISYSTSLGLSLHVNGALIGSQQVKLRDQCIKIFFSFPKNRDWFPLGSFFP